MLTTKNRRSLKMWLFSLLLGSTVLAAHAVDFNGWQYKSSHESTEFKHRLKELKSSYKDKQAVDVNQLAALFVADLVENEAQYQTMMKQIESEVATTIDDIEKFKSGWIKTQWLNNRWLKQLQNAKSDLAKTLFLKVFIDQYRPKPKLEKKFKYAFHVLLSHYSNQLERENTQWLKLSIDQHGWFDISKYSEDAAQGAWLIIQHSDFDPQWQQQMLAFLRPKVDSGDFQGKCYAYLVDRVATNAGKPQVFGTQGFCSKEKLWQFFPIKERDNIDKTRATVGLEPLEEYRKKFKCR